MPRDMMDSIRGLLVYASRTYRYMNPFFNGVHLKLDSWRPYMYEEGWIMRVEELNMAKVEWGWEVIEEVDNPILVV